MGPSNIQQQRWLKGLSVSALIEVLEVEHSGFKSHLRTTFYHFVFTRCKSRLDSGFASCDSFTVSIRVSLVIRKTSLSVLSVVYLRFESPTKFLYKRRE